MSFGPSGPYLKLKFVVIFQPIRELEFRGRLSDFFLSPQFAIKDQVCIQLSLLCERITYFTLHNKENPVLTFNLLDSYMYYKYKLTHGVF